VSEPFGRVLVIGATGSIGRLVVERLRQLGDEPRALSRHPERARSMFGPDVEIVAGDITDKASLAKATVDVDGIVMTHGAPYGSGDYESIDYGAVPAVLAALGSRQVPIVLMTSIGVTGNGGSSRDLLNWKRRGERLLRASGKPYTIVRPGWFDAGTGDELRIDLRQGDAVDYGPVRREHVAEVLAQALRLPAARGRTVEVFSAPGDPIVGWPAAFSALDADRSGSLDGAGDISTLPLDHEPAEVVARTFVATNIRSLRNEGEAMRYTQSGNSTTKGPQAQFTGDVYVDSVRTPDDQTAIGCAHVRFTPGARTAWHHHPKGQTLYVTDGIGLVATRTQGVQEIKPGDVVYIEPGEEHWHGATPDRFMSHVALQEADDSGQVVTWLDHVTDEEYRS
jgi:uncharacterized protein YbjT (DUF2867 family)/quercetin dioxygenase-like cupin family protein